MGPASENAGYDEVQLLANKASGLASMGPASENAGYGQSALSICARSVASMGPASENAGYAVDPSCATRAWTAWLQWVRRPRTPVMVSSRRDEVAR